MAVLCRVLPERLGGRLLLGYLVAVGVGLVVARIPLRKVLRKSLADKIEGEMEEEHIHSEDSGCSLGCR